MVQYSAPPPQYFSAHAFYFLVFDLLHGILLTPMEQASLVSNIFSANTFTRQLGNSNSKSFNLLYTATAELRHLLQFIAENLCVFHAAACMGGSANSSLHTSPSQPQQHCVQPADTSCP